MRPAFTVLRIQKLKTWGAVAGSGKHNQRERETLNADASKVSENLILAGYKEIDLVAACKEAIGNQTIRKNAVLGVEMLLSASPSYFRPDNPEQAGLYNEERLEDWRQTTMDWLNNRYGKRIVSAVLHLDESTPHIHALLVPLDNSGKLNCRALFGGTRHTLSMLQTDYGNAVSGLGIERGIKNSKATHQKVSQYYTRTQKEGAQNIPKVQKYEAPPLPTKLSRMSDDTLKNFSRKAALSGAEAQYTVATDVLSSLRNEINILKDQKLQFKQANSFLAHEVETYKVKLKRLRGIQPEKVLKQLYKAKGPYREKDEWYCVLPDKRKVFITETSWKVEGVGRGRGAIDLVMAIDRYAQKDLDRVVGELGYVFGKDRAVAELAEELFIQAEQRVEENIRKFIPQKEKGKQVDLSRGLSR